jgi:hypothetical protein
MIVLTPASCISVKRDEQLASQQSQLQGSSGFFFGASLFVLSVVLDSNRAALPAAEYRLAVLDAHKAAHGTMNRPASNAVRRQAIRPGGPWETGKDE